MSAPGDRSCGEATAGARRAGTSEPDFADDLDPTGVGHSAMDEERWKSLSATARRARLHDAMFVFQAIADIGQDRR